MHTSLRLKPELTEFIDGMSKNSGWSNAKCVSFLADAGIAAIRNQSGALTAFRAQWEGALALHKVEADNARRLAEVRAAVRAAVAPSAVRTRKAPAAPKASAKLPAVPPAAKAGSAA